MIVLKILKWLIIGAIGLLAATFVCVWLYFGVINPVEPPDIFHGVEPDLGNGPLEEVMSHDLAFTKLGNTEYRVNIGTSRFIRNKDKSWDYYYCWIYKRYMEEKFGETWHPFFSRWIPAKDVPDDLWDKSIEEIIKFDEVNRVVTFDLGFTNIVTTLPPD